MFDREIVARNDLLAADVALAAARQNRSRARNAVSLARAAYNRRLGQPLAREVDLEQSLPAPATTLDREPIERLTERALAHRGELKALEAQALAVGYQADAERARIKPQLMLSGGYSHLGNDVLDREDFVTASLGFSWSIDGGVARKRSAALRRQQNAVQQRRADMEAMIALEVQQAMLDAQEAQARVVVTADAVAQSEENLRITRQQYQAGLVISTRVLEAESLRVISRTNHDNAVLDAALTQYRLARAVGEL
jgi:outer membrane protein TolC